MNPVKKVSYKAECLLKIKVQFFRDSTKHVEMIFSLNGRSLPLKRKVGSQVPIKSSMKINTKNRELPIINK